MALHWLIAIVMIGMLILGKYIDANQAYHLMPLHKSIGIAIFAFILWRCVLRLQKGFPSALGNPPFIQHLLAKVVHIVLLLGTFLFPLSGMIMSAMGGRGLSLFGIELFAMNIVDGKPTPINPELAGLASNIHGALLPIMIVAIVLHIIGAIYHHRVVKDDTLNRMLGRV
ncbi:cytochrome b [Pelistega sp. NLN82]|uniref:Cytochrome b n=1 Tax=Pelistega ratti TaxID=2652177 RepID=A0A6L9Y5S8_9BURK|nr:cytochrome b [Pelistega ratti]